MAAEILARKSAPQELAGRFTNVDDVHYELVRSDGSLQLWRTFVVRQLAGVKHRIVRLHLFDENGGIALFIGRQADAQALFDHAVLTRFAPRRDGLGGYIPSTTA